MARLFLYRLAMPPTIVAIDPISENGKQFEKFCAIIRAFQDKGVFSRTSIASIIHGSLYSVPLGWYHEMKHELAAEALSRITGSCRERIDFDSAKVLLSDSHLNEDLVSQISKYAHRAKHQLLVVSSHSRKGLPRWILGSFSETAALTATLPVLVIKPALAEQDFSRVVRFVLAIDTTSPPSQKHLQWIVKLAKPANAHVDVVYVEPRPRQLIDSLYKRKPKSDAEKILKAFVRDLRANGVNSRLEIRNETKSVAQTIADYAEERKSWLCVTVNANRSATRKLLIGSTARKILSLSNRPFLSLRFEA